MQNFSSIGSVLGLSTRLKENYKYNNKDEQTDMYEHLDPLSEQAVQKISETCGRYTELAEVSCMSHCRFR